MVDWIAVATVAAAVAALANFGIVCTDRWWKRRQDKYDTLLEFGATDYDLDSQEFRKILNRISITFRGSYPVNIAVRKIHMATPRRNSDEINALTKGLTKVMLENVGLEKTPLVSDLLKGKIK